MRSTISAIAVLFISVFAMAANAQTTTPPTAVIPVKIAVIDTDEFANPTTGIKKLLNGFNQVEARLKPLRDEIVGMQTRLNTLATEIQNAQKAGTTPPQAKIDEAQQLDSDIKRKQEDGQKAYQRYSKQIVEPLNIEVAKAVEVFVKAKGYDMLLDLAKFNGSMMVLNPGIDVTKAFVADYNAKNPATVTPAATTPVKP
jgi:Skp family chaperone for outer membrane proteins